ncbi:MAG: hypothetical protein SPL96_11155 [Bacteroidales bacterium]|nr:hypothetical protein [Bacteroidales bacterium]
MAKKTVTITLSIEELLYELQDKTYHLSLGKGDARAADRIQNTHDEERLSLARRFLHTAIADAHAAISEFLPEGSVVNNNRLRPGGGDVVFSLTLPANYNDGATDGLTAAIHRYIVDRALGEWLAVTDDTQEARLPMAQASIDMAEVKRLLLTRKRPDRRPSVKPGGGGDDEESDHLWHRIVNWVRSRAW